MDVKVKSPQEAKMADLKMPADTLKGVSDSDQRRIEEILKNTGLLDAQDHVVAQTGDSDELEFRIQLIFEQTHQAFGSSLFVRLTAVV